MSEPLIMPVKTASISKADKKKLQQVGVVVVECENPSELRLIKPWAELDGSDLLLGALKALTKSQSADLKGVFIEHLFAALERKAAAQPTGGKDEGPRS